MLRPSELSRTNAWTSTGDQHHARIHAPCMHSLYAMPTLRDEPPRSLEDPREILLQQLSYYRTTLLAKLEGLSEDQLTTSILPSGWSPLGLLKHLVFVERRWMQWGFEAEDVPDPWGDHDPNSGSGSSSPMRPSTC